jgi:hypothetical protein
MFESTILFTVKFILHKLANESAIIHQLHDQFLMTTIIYYDLYGSERQKQSSLVQEPFTKITTKWAVCDKRFFYVFSLLFRLIFVTFVELLLVAS